MKIVLSGVETQNKGAELMLYSILQEIERKWPDTVVYIPNTYFKQGLGYVKTSLKVKFWPYDRALRLLRGVLGRLHLPTKRFLNTFIVPGADYFLDASGFHFSDQKRNFTPAKVKRWNVLLQKYSKQGTKIVFLPQAFGPAKKDNTLNGLKCISKYADLIMPRERVSYNYLEQSGVMDMRKVVLCSDFTSLAKGSFPSGYEHLRNGVCLIPNMRMIDTGACPIEDYINLMSNIIVTALKTGHPVYLLNHEDVKDEQLAIKCKADVKQRIEVVTGLNALQVKGMIASAYMVVSSRFHGVASSLNSCVPCLATSWSHKYQELFRDYDLEGSVLPLDNITLAVEKVNEYLDEANNVKIRQHLVQRLPSIQDKTRQMWDLVWKEK